MKSRSQNFLWRGRTGNTMRWLLTTMVAGVVGVACDVHSPTAPGSLARITVTPNPTLAINATQLFVAVGTDAEGAVVDISPEWSIVAGGGAIDDAGLFTAGTVPGSFTATVQATSDGMTGTANVTVVVGPLVTLQVTPNPDTLAIGGVQQFTAIGRDAGGNVVPITPVWSITASGGSIDSSGRFTAGTVAGTFTNTIRATSGTLGASATVTIITGALASITVTPNPDTLQANTTQQFTAVGRDGNGNVVAISPTWAVVAGGGAISGTGLFLAGSSAGTFANTVRAQAGGISGSATVVVTPADTTTPPPPPPPTLATIEVIPNPDTLGVNTTQLFTAVGRDGSGNVVAISPSWAVVAGGGTISSIGLFLAGSTPGTFTNTIRARSGTISGFATVVVTAVSPPPPPPPIVNLGAAATHGILAGSTITCVALGTVNADASVWPGSAITGFPPCVITGARHAADPFAQTAQAALTSAYNQLDAMPCGEILSADLGGRTLQPGVYCSLSSQGLTGEMFFDALGDPNATFVVKAASTLITAAARVTLLNGAQARNIYWLVGSSATIGVGSVMRGNIITFTSITLNNNSGLLGRALARNGAVTLGTGNVITLP